MFERCRSFTLPDVDGMDGGPAEGFLFRFDPDGRLHRVLEGVSFGGSSHNVLPPDF